jgi:hypothetical protein
MTAGARRAAWGAAIAIVLIVITGSVWAAAVFVPRDPLTSGLALRFPWPVACSLRGCLTTRSWQQHWIARQTFARAAGQPEPSHTEALTTLARQHLVHHAFLRVPVAQEDAVRYRQEVLNLHDEAAVRETTGLTLADYDERVLLPLLQQEALRQERSHESLDELFVTLANERALFVFPRHLKWNKEAARVEER